MFTELLGFISQLGDTVAGILTKGAYWMWPILVRQQYIDALTQLGVCFVLSIIFIPWSVKMLRWCKNEKTAFWEYNRNDRDVSKEVASVIIWIITCIVIGATIATICDQLPRLLNPEYYAFIEAKEIIQIIK